MSGSIGSSTGVSRTGLISEAPVDSLARQSGQGRVGYKNDAKRGFFSKWALSWRTDWHQGGWSGKLSVIGRGIFNATGAGLLIDLSVSRIRVAAGSHLTTMWKESSMSIDQRNNQLRYEYSRLIDNAPTPHDNESSRGSVTEYGDNNPFTDHFLLGQTDRVTSSANLGKSDYLDEIKRGLDQTRRSLGS